MMKYAAICDDNRAWLERGTEVLETYLKEHDMDVQIFCYNDIDKCIEGLPADSGVLFMDIEWEEKLCEAGAADDSALGRITPKGIETAAIINEKYPDCRIVYLTNHLGYALDVYNTEHAWYVLKEQFEDRLPEVFEKLETLEEERKQSIVLRTYEGRTVRALCSDICYMERMGRKTKIVMNNDEIEVRAKITELESLLPTSVFARCHNSIIVNLARVKEIHKGELMLDDGQALPISRGHNRSFRTKYMNWAKDRAL